MRKISRWTQSIGSHPLVTMIICNNTKSYSSLFNRYASALPQKKTTGQNCHFVQDVNIFQWNKALPRFVCWFWVNTTCSVVKDKPLKGNMNLCPSAWGQLHPYGLLDPPGPMWCEVSWSDASLAACLLSKEAIRVSYSPPAVLHVAVKLLYILNGERKKGVTLPPGVFTMVEEMSPFAFMNGLVQWSEEKGSVNDWFNSDLNCCNGWHAELWMVNYHTFCLFWNMCEFAWLLKGDITKIGH